MTVERLPPQSRDAERCVLGSMLRDNGVIGAVVPMITAEDFYADAHRKIFQAIVSLYEKGQPVDLVILAQLLEERKQIDDVGRHAYLAELWDAAPTAAHAEYYARIVADKALVRNLIHASTEILRDAYDQAEPGQALVEAAARKIFALAQQSQCGQVTELREAISRAYDYYDELATREVKGGLPTGFLDLDAKTGGLHDSELIIVAARPSVGKSALAFNIARKLITDRRVPLFFASLEMDEIMVSNRFLCAQGPVDGQQLRTATLDSDNQVRYLRAGQELQPPEAATLYFDFKPKPTVLHIAARARWHKQQHGIRAVFIDYLGLIEPDDWRLRREQQVARISRELKHLARELKVPVVAMSQLNRQVEGRSDDKPRLSDLRDSGSLEQDADTVLFLHCADKKADPRETTVDVAKQRNGPIGDVTLMFWAKTQRFEDYVPGDDGFSTRTGTGTD